MNLFGLSYVYILIKKKQMLSDDVTPNNKRVLIFFIIIITNIHIIFTIVFVSIDLSLSNHSFHREVASGELLQTKCTNILFTDMYLMSRLYFLKLI